MTTPLKTLRLKRGLTLKEVSKAVDTDTGNLSRIENASQTASKDIAERIANYFGHEVTEMQIIYPERYPSQAINQDHGRRESDKVAP